MKTQPDPATDMGATIIYPQPDGIVMPESEPENHAIESAWTALSLHYRNDPTVYVGNRKTLYLFENDNRQYRVPNILIAVDVDDPKPRTRWMPWCEGKAPDFILEVATPGTADMDKGIKRNQYQEIGVREYWRFDPTGVC